MVALKCFVTPVGCPSISELRHVVRAPKGKLLCAVAVYAVPILGIKKMLQFPVLKIWHLLLTMQFSKKKFFFKEERKVSLITAFCSRNCQLTHHTVLSHVRLPKSHHII